MSWETKEYTKEIIILYFIRLSNTMKGSSLYER